MTTPSPHQPEEWITEYDLRGAWATKTYKEEIRAQINKKIATRINTERQAAKEQVLREIWEKAAFNKHGNVMVIHKGELEGIALRHNITL